MNIRLRLTFWYTGVLTLILVVFSAAVYLGLGQSLFLTLDTHLKREVAQVIGGLKFSREDDHEEEGDDHETSARRAQTGLELTYWPEEGILWRILDPQGGLLVDSGRLDGVAIDPNIAALDHTRFDYSALSDGTPIKLYTVPFMIEGQGAGIVQVAESYQHIQDVQHQLVLLFAIGVPFTVLAEPPSTLAPMTSISASI